RGNGFKTRPVWVRVPPGAPEMNPATCFTAGRRGFFVPFATYRMVLPPTMGRTVGGTMREGTGGEDMDQNVNADGYGDGDADGGGNDGGYGSEWARPPLWKIALAVLSILAGAAGLFAAISLRG